MCALPSASIYRIKITQEIALQNIMSKNYKSKTNITLPQIFFCMQDPPQQLRQGLRARPARGGQEGGGEAEAPNQESKRGEDEFFLLES